MPGPFEHEVHEIRAPQAGTPGRVATNPAARFFDNAAAGSKTAGRCCAGRPINVAGGSQRIRGSRNDTPMARCRAPRLGDRATSTEGKAAGRERAHSLRAIDGVPVRYRREDIRRGRLRLASRAIMMMVVRQSRMMSGRFGGRGRRDKCQGAQQQQRRSNPMHSRSPLLLILCLCCNAASKDPQGQGARGNSMMRMRPSARISAIYGHSEC